jgi:hypothetical protein
MAPTSEQRQHPRHDVVSAIMITPNGHQHEAQLMNLSLGGARVDLPEGWTPSDGANLRVFFLLDTADAVALEARVVRVAVDHLGLEFAPTQERRIEHLMDVLRPGR